MTADISEEELHDTVAYLREYSRRLTRLLPAAKMYLPGDDVDDIPISLNELVPLDIESALRPFCETPRAYARFRFSWALHDLLRKLWAVADFGTGREAPPGLFSFVRHAIRAIFFAFLRLERAEEDETVSPEPTRGKLATTLRRRVPAFDDFLRTPPDVIEIIRAYRAVLDDHLGPIGYAEVQECSPEPRIAFLKPDWLLPRPKEDIEKALRTALGIARNRRIRHNLNADLESLKNYVPADTIPEGTLWELTARILNTPQEHIEAWKRVQATGTDSGKPARTRATRKELSR
jgi:hypothetical protein